MREDGIRWLSGSEALQIAGFASGLAEADFIEARRAGNAVVLQIAEGVAEHLKKAIIEDKKR